MRRRMNDILLLLRMQVLFDICLYCFVISKFIPFFSIWNNSKLTLLHILSVFSNIFKVYIIKEWMQVKRSLFEKSLFCPNCNTCFFSTVKMLFRIMYDSAYISQPRFKLWLLFFYYEGIWNLWIIKRILFISNQY